MLSDIISLDHQQEQGDTPARNDSHGKFSLTSLAASTFAGEFKSGTSADRSEMTEINCTRKLWRSNARRIGPDISTVLLVGAYLS